MSTIEEADSSFDADIDFIANAIKRTKDDLKVSRHEEWVRRSSVPIEQKAEPGHDADVSDDLDVDGLSERVSEAKRQKTAPVVQEEESQRTDSPTPPENRRVTRQTPTGLRPPVVPKQKKQGRAMQRLNALMRSVGKKILQDSDHRAKQGHRHDEDSDDVILEDYDEEIMLKVQYKHHITRLNVRKGEKLRSVFDRVGRKLGVDSGDLEFFLRDERLKHNDTVIGKSIGVASIVEARPKSTKPDPLQGEDTMVVRFQTKDKRSLQSIRLMLNETMASALEKYSQQQKTSPQKLEKARLYFDGDEIDVKETPETLELEGGECIDIVL